MAFETAMQLRRENIAKVKKRSLVLIFPIHNSYQPIATEVLRSLSHIDLLATL